MPAYVVLRDDVRRSDQQTLDAQALLICAAVAVKHFQYLRLTRSTGRKDSQQHARTRRNTK